LKQQRKGGGKNPQAVRFPIWPVSTGNKKKARVSFSNEKGGEKKELVVEDPGTALNGLGREGERGERSICCLKTHHQGGGKKKKPPNAGKNRTQDRGKQKRLVL